MKKQVIILSEYPTNEGDVAVVEQYNGCNDVIVSFKDSNTPTGFTLKCRLGDLRRGRVKNPYKQQIYGIGYKGVGPYLTSVLGTNTKCYKTWAGMLERCYSEKFHLNRPTYINCTTDHVWHNFQNFAEWFEYNYIEGWELDKDLILKRNKEYGPQTCCFLPRELNVLIVRNERHRGEFPIGVRQRNGKWNSQISIGTGKTLNLGNYESIHDAFYAYKEKKESIIKELANKFRGSLSCRVYEALINWKVEIED